MEQQDNGKNTSAQELCNKTASGMPAPAPRTARDFPNLALWVASPEYAVLAAKSIVAEAERKRLKSIETAKTKKARKKAGLPLKARDFCRVVFKVPTVLSLPAPGQVLRWPAQTIYSPIKVKAATPRRTRPDHHRPQWQIDAERVIIITPREFGYLVQALGMTAEECAAYLRVTAATVRAWEAGDVPIPFSAFWLLRMTIRATRFNARFPEWEGWVIAEDGPDAGKLIDAHRTGAFSPHEIACIPRAWHLASVAGLRADKLQAKLDEAIAENTRLRELFNANGVTAEVRQMQDRISAVLARIGTAKVFDYKPATAGRQLERVA